jgi:hypothetical protein
MSNTWLEGRLSILNTRHSAFDHPFSFSGESLLQAAVELCPEFTRIVWVLGVPSFIFHLFDNFVYPVQNQFVVGTQRHFSPVKTTRIRRPRRLIPHISVQILIPGGEADGVLADPGALHRVVPADTVVLAQVPVVSDTCVYSPARRYLRIIDADCAKALAL